MKKLQVHLSFSTNNSVFVGNLIENEKRKIYFEYDANFLLKNLNISPFKLDFRLGLQECNKEFLGYLHGVFNDSLPDGWGLLLMDRFFTKAGFNSGELSHIDRLAFLGARTMGALTYKPAMDVEFGKNLPIDLYKISLNSLEILKGREKDVLPVLLRAGGSPCGARPKILVGFNGEDLISGESELPESFEPWIIKFRSEKDFNDAGKIEFAYAKMAKMAGLAISECRLFQDNNKNYYFGTRRFDRTNNGRIHFHSFGNLIHSDFRIPSVDYEILLKVCLKLTHSYEAVKACFRVMLFNILSYNRDDHVKNFAFLMDENGEWSFAPAFDLMFSLGPGGEHSMTICGEGRNPTLREIDKLANLFQIKNQDKVEMIDTVKYAVGKFKEISKKLDISKEEIQKIEDYHKRISLNSK